MYFLQLGSMLIGLIRGGERDLVHSTASRVERGGAARVLGHDTAAVSKAARTGMRRATATTGVAVKDGLRKVEIHPLGKEGSYVRKVHVYGADRDRIIASLPGPATGPNGFAPEMVSVTPVEKQFHADRTTKAEKMRLPHLPESMGATVEGRPTADGMAFTMHDGLTSGEFTLKVSPERRLADGTKEVVVTEEGRFSLLREKPKSLLGVPAYLFSHLTPMGWLLQATGGAAVSDAHIALFQLEAVLRKRLNLR